MLVVNVSAHSGAYQGGFRFVFVDPNPHLELIFPLPPGIEIFDRREVAPSLFLASADRQ
jgi:hypothetical protein